MKLEKRVVDLVQRILKADVAATPEWLLRPGKAECGPEWDRVRRIYAELSGQSLPDVMRRIESRRVDAVFLIRGRPPRIMEVDERQHFNQFRSLTLRHYLGEQLAFDQDAWISASVAKRTLEGGGFARPMPPLFPGVNGRHRQRAFRDALCDLLPPIYGFAPTLRIADFEVGSWIDTGQAEERMTALLADRLPVN